MNPKWTKIPTEISRGNNEGEESGFGCQDHFKITVGIKSTILVSLTLIW